jgi:small subunit ribosomal protein S18
MPRRLTGTSKKMQEMVEVAIKRARHMALVPYIVNTQNMAEAAYSRN